MIDRAFSTIGLWVAVGLIIWVGGFFSLAEQAAFGLLAILVAMAQYEFYQLAKAIPGTRAPSFSGILTGFALLFTLYFIGNERLRANYLTTAAATAFGIYLLSLLRNPHTPSEFLKKFPTVFGFLYLPLMLSPLVAIARMEDGVLLSRQPIGLYYVLWVVIATKFTDVGGLLIGVPLGKHKIAPQISPAKSWEGVLGGLLVSALVSAAFAWFCNATLGLHFMVPYKAALLALPLAALSVPSDLIESVFKRQAGVKDSGRTIPGIGGALDLIDSLVLTAPTALILLSFWLDWAKVAG
jgi:phosphatidate cytidylyltransferase